MTPSFDAIVYREERLLWRHAPPGSAGDDFRCPFWVLFPVTCSFFLCLDERLFFSFWKWWNTFSASVRVLSAVFAAVLAANGETAVCAAASRFRRRPVQARSRQEQGGIWEGAGTE